VAYVGLGGADVARADLAGPPDLGRRPAGRYLAGHALSAPCGYRLDLAHETVNDPASLPAAGSSGGTGFTLFGRADGAIGLGGQCDPTSGVALSPRSAPPFAARPMGLLAASGLQNAEEGTDT
jgi:hypothetical protein